MGSLKQFRHVACGFQITDSAYWHCSDGGGASNMHLLCIGGFSGNPEWSQVSLGLVHVLLVLLLFHDPPDHHFGVYQPEHQSAYFMGRLHHGFCYVGHTYDGHHCNHLPHVLRLLLLLQADRGVCGVLVVFWAVRRRGLVGPQKTWWETSGFLTTIPGLLRSWRHSSPASYLCLWVPSNIGSLQEQSGAWASTPYASFFHCWLFSSPSPSCLPSFHFLLTKWSLASTSWPWLCMQPLLLSGHCMLLTKNSRPTDCKRCPWDDLVVVTFMTVINFLVYIGDMAYSVKIVFFSQHGQE